MKDRWINAGHEEDELKPFVEPELDISDQKRIGNGVLSRVWYCLHDVGGFFFSPPPLCVCLILEKVTNPLKLILDQVFVLKINNSGLIL